MADDNFSDIDLASEAGTGVFMSDEDQRQFTELMARSPAAPRSPPPPPAEDPSYALLPSPAAPRTFATIVPANVETVLDDLRLVLTEVLRGTD